MFYIDLYIIRFAFCRRGFPITLPHIAERRIDSFLIAYISSGAIGRGGSVREKNLASFSQWRSIFFFRRRILEFAGIIKKTMSHSCFP